MACEYCGRDSGHAERCPLHENRKSNYICCYCKEGIFNGDEFIVNSEGEYLHRDCIFSYDFLANWLGYDFKEMGKPGTGNVLFDLEKGMTGFVFKELFEKNGGKFKC